MANLEQKIKNTFHHLHNHAEISWEEIETTNYIKHILQEQGCDVHTFTDHTGVIGRFGNFEKDLPIVAIRADIDALWQEVDGTFQANHSCGHDAHMAMVLGLLWKLKQSSSLQDKVAIKFIFQPAEETGTGALKLVEKGVVEDVDYLFGVHLRPKQETPMHNAAPVIVHGACKTYKAKIIGVDAHGARPHLNTNAIEVGAQIVQLLSKIHLDPTVPHSVKMTSFQAGSKSTNIIPGSATFAIDMRAQTNEAMDELDKQVGAIFDSIQHLYPINIDIMEKHGIAAAKTNKEATSIMTTAITNVLGKEAVQPPLITPGGDDFHFYTIKKPELKATMLGLGCDLTPGLHHPQMTFNSDALINGVEILTEAVRQVYEL
ncbi:M20 peptidase aminoacylase family protein [Virgibacillus sp. Bac330]|uniref:M20 peptidase aminoacylase family protein n=1 Tax=Virgibacillus sp. Bac330 TaxID=2419841 RepID=UPI000EF475D3|nr:M20 peptidase aminoacylase family protein [Virgibacillus sp. Bac330]